MNDMKRSELRILQGALLLYRGQITEEEFKKLFDDVPTSTVDWKITDLIDRLEELAS